MAGITLDQHLIYQVAGAALEAVVGLGYTTLAAAALGAVVAALLTQATAEAADLAEAEAAAEVEAAAEAVVWVGVVVAQALHQAQAAQLAFSFTTDRIHYD